MLDGGEEHTMGDRDALRQRAVVGAVALSGLWVRTQGTPWLQPPMIAVTAGAAAVTAAALRSTAGPRPA